MYPIQSPRSGENDVNREEKNRKLFSGLCLILAIVSFFLFAIPNAKASENLAMIQIFEPDEAALYPVISEMARPKGDLITFLKQFIVYGRYNKGLPFYGPSALLLLILRMMGFGEDFPIIFLTLRQFISVLPMLCGLYLLVKMQDGFRTYRSVLVFLFLLIVPATMYNGFWWHTDGLTLLLSVLVLYFLFKDNLQFGKYFYLSAIACGVLTATKVMGPFFFLTVAIVLILGLVNKQITFRRALGLGLSYFVIMAASFVISNPFLFSKWGRAGYFNMIRSQMSSLSSGYGVVYEKGVVAAWPSIRKYFGEAAFLIASLVICIYGIILNKNRFLNLLILSWFIPLTIYVLFFSHFKYQYWLPVALPILSSWIQVFPDKFSGWTKNHREFVRIGFILIFLFQYILFIKQSTRTYIARIYRAENNPSIQFYDIVVEELSPLIEKPLRVYYDYRLYVPNGANWSLHTAYDPLSYRDIEEGNFDVLLLIEQRVRDYLNPDIKGIDPEQFSQVQRFYYDVDRENVNGYKLIARNDIGLIFVNQEFCGVYFSEEQCR